MNYHTREWIMNEVRDHYNESLNYFNSNSIVTICLQGSQNYGLDTPTSDVDTKLILVPSFKDIALNQKAISTTHIQANDSHTDWKDIRLMLQTFRKQNLNFLEILFTDYKIQNPIYSEQWNRLVAEKEAIARYSPVAAIKSMKGLAMKKYQAMEHEYPTKLAVLAKWGYDMKQLCHLLRIEEYIERYISGEAYKDCLLTKQSEYLIAIKDYEHPLYNLEQAREIAFRSICHIINMTEKFFKGKNPKDVNIYVDELLDDVQYQIMRKAMEVELT